MATLNIQPPHCNHQGHYPRISIQEFCGEPVGLIRPNHGSAPQESEHKHALCTPRAEMHPPPKSQNKWLWRKRKFSLAPQPNKIMLSPAASAQGLTALHYPALPRRIAQQGGVAPPRSTSSPPRGGLVAPRSIYAPQGGVAPSSTPSSPTSDGHHHYPGNLATARHLDAPPSPHPLGSFLSGGMPSQRVLQQRRTQGISDMWEGIPDGLGAQGTVRGLPSFTSGNHALPPVRTSGQQDGDPTGNRPNPPFNPDPQTPPLVGQGGGLEPETPPTPPPPQEPNPPHRPKSARRPREEK